jgi:hypothetical protein
MKTKTTMSGSKLIVLLALVLAGVIQARNKDKKAAESFAIIAGTVYRPPGFSLPGAEVQISPEKSDVDGTKFKKIKVATDARGEFAVRVPVVPMRYVVNVQMNGYVSQQKSVAIEGEQRQDLSFVLDEGQK